MFDLSVGVWSVAKTDLPRLWGHTAVVHGGKMVVYGGYRADTGTTSRVVYEYDFATDVFATQVRSGKLSTPPAVMKTVVVDANTSHTPEENAHSPSLPKGLNIIVTCCSSNTTDPNSLL